MEITNIDARLIEKNGVIASCWVELSSGIAFKVLVLRNRQDGSEYIKLPTEKYTDRSGNVQWRKLVTITSESLYDKLVNACLTEVKKLRDRTNQPVSVPPVPHNSTPPQTNAPAKDKNDADDLLSDVFDDAELDDLFQNNI